MSSMHIEKLVGSEITDEMISAAAKLFSLNYGVWGPLAEEKIGVKAGARIKISSKKLIEKILPTGENIENIYIRIKIADKLEGNVFATRWIHEGRPMIWITQLCVSSKFCNQHVAEGLLMSLQEDGVAGFGILSSHPFAIMAVLRMFGGGLENVDLEMTRLQAKAVMASCPVGYVREAKLKGSLFGDDGMGQGGKAVSCADTQFWVDHEEPMEALRLIKKKKKKGYVWPLGELPDGHEFLVIVKGGKNQD